MGRPTSINVDAKGRLWPVQLSVLDDGNTREKVDARKGDPISLGTCGDPMLAENLVPAFFCDEDPPCLGIGIEWPGYIHSRFLQWCLDRSRFPKPCCQTSGFSLRTTCSYSTCYRQTYHPYQPYHRLNTCAYAFGRSSIPLFGEIPKYACLRTMSWKQVIRMSQYVTYINVNPPTWSSWMFLCFCHSEQLLTKASLQHHTRVLRLVIHGHVAGPPQIWRKSSLPIS